MLATTPALLPVLLVRPLRLQLRPLRLLLLRLLPSSSPREQSTSTTLLRLVPQLLRPPRILPLLLLRRRRPQQGVSRRSIAVGGSSSGEAVRVCDVLCFVRWLLPTCDTLVKSASQGSHVGGVRASPDDPPAAQK